jgi:cellulose synthase/poly-beta-1,6-N-acetylglucosamine synthase-like glycosyltransferase
MSIKVIERSDSERRGKGFALDFARLHLRQDRPDVVIVMDADCKSDRKSIETLIAQCVTTGRACQAAYLQSPVPDGSPTLQLSTFAFFIKNLIRQRGLQRLAGRARLVGTGMAFPGPIFDSAALATGNIVEDLQLGLELAEAGSAPLFIEQATVWSSPASTSDTLDQRRRWEGGYFQSAAHWVPRLLGRSLRRLDLRELWAAVSLLIPPLAFLVLVDVGGMILAGAATWLGLASGWPLIMIAGSLVTAGLALLAAWVSGGSRFVRLGTLARVPFYILWKIPLYLGLVRRGAPKEWLRTRRS